MNNSPNLMNALLAAAAQINATGGNAHYLDLRVGTTEGCGGNPGSDNIEKEGGGHPEMMLAALPVVKAVMGW